LLATLRVDDLLDNVAQFHQIDQDCAKCHLPTGGRLVSDVSAPTDSRLSAKRTFYEPPTGPDVPAIHRNGAIRNDEGQDCFHCHWTGLRTGSVSGGGPTPNPETEDIRNEKGKRLKHFPGVPR
jgi:hypothetical protein